MAYIKVGDRCNELLQVRRVQIVMNMSREEFTLHCKKHALDVNIVSDVSW